MFVGQDHGSSGGSQNMPSDSTQDNDGMYMYMYMYVYVKTIIMDISRGLLMLLAGPTCIYVYS